MKHTSFISDIKKLDTFTTLNIGQALDVFGSSSYGMVFFILGVVIVIPTGIIPGIAVITSIFISALAMQYAAGIKNIYLPKKVKQITVPTKFVKALSQYVKKHEERIAAVFVPERNKKILKRPLSAISAGLLVLVAFTMIPLTLLPIIEMVPGFIISMFGLALLFADGRIMMFNWVISIMYLASFAWFFSALTSLIT